MSTLPEHTNQEIDDFVDALAQVDLETHFLPQQEDAVLYTPSHGKGLLIGGTRILSPSFKFALIEKLQDRFLDLKPMKISELFSMTCHDICMNFKRQGSEWDIANRIVIDPQANYAELSAKAALNVHGKSSSMENLFWGNFLEFMPNKEQLVQYKKDISTFSKKHYPDTWDFYTELAELHEQHSFQPTNWYQQVQVNAPSFEYIKNQELDILKNKAAPETNQLRDQSRTELLTDPKQSFMTLLSYYERGKTKIKEETLSVLCARALYMAETDDQFAYDADDYLHRAFSYRVNALDFGTQGDDLAFCLHQYRIEIGDRFMHLDQAALRKQTEFLKTQPKP
jgi:hypothetical protein